MSEQTIVVGDWVVAGGRDDLDCGEIVALDGDTAEVAWQSGVRTSLDVSADDVDVYSTKAKAEARYTERSKANPSPVGWTGA